MGSAILDALAERLLHALTLFFRWCGAGSLLSRGHDGAFPPGPGTRVLRTPRMVA